MDIKLINRGLEASASIKYEMVTFRVTADQLKKLIELTERYSTTRTDILIQLIDLAHKSIKSE